jgi:hypothetical protein
MEAGLNLNPISDATAGFSADQIFRLGIRFFQEVFAKGGCYYEYDRQRQMLYIYKNHRYMFGMKVKLGDDFTFARDSRFFAVDYLGD